MHELKFNDLKDNTFLIKEEFKKKGKNYGVLILSKKIIETALCLRTLKAIHT